MNRILYLFKEKIRTCIHFRSRFYKLYQTLSNILSISHEVLMKMTLDANETIHHILHKTLQSIKSKKIISQKTYLNNFT